MWCEKRGLIGIGVVASLLLHLGVCYLISNAEKESEKGDEKSSKDKKFKLCIKAQSTLQKIDPGKDIQPIDPPHTM